MKITGVYFQSHVEYINILCEVNKEHLVVSRRQNKYNLTSRRVRETIVAV
jgi:hypothetical protein